jgi:hypothetical protein
MTVSCRRRGRIGRASAIARTCIVVTSLVVTPLVVALASAGAGRAETQRQEWEHDWVALTIAQNGTWGTATNGNLTRAMMQAIRACFAKSGRQGNDCGAEITTVRAAWSLAYACGDYTFVANGDSSADARIAAIERAAELRDLVGIDLPPCALVVAVGADGRAMPPERREILALPKPRP